MGAQPQTEEFLVSARADLIDARENWLKSLKNTRRLAANTLEAYERDTRQFFQFLTGHLGEPPALKDVATLRIADFARFWPAAAMMVPELARSGAGLRAYAPSCVIWKSRAWPMPLRRSPCARRASRNPCRSR